MTAMHTKTRSQRTTPAGGALAMLHRLAWKEWRENRILFPAALVAALLLGSSELEVYLRRLDSNLDALPGYFLLVFVMASWAGWVTAHAWSDHVYTRAHLPAARVWPAWFTLATQAGMALLVGAVAAAFAHDGVYFTKPLYSFYVAVPGALLLLSTALVSIAAAVLLSRPVGMVVALAWLINFNGEFTSLWSPRKQFDGLDYQAIPLEDGIFLPLGIVIPLLALALAALVERVSSRQRHWAVVGLFIAGLVGVAVWQHGDWGSRGRDNGYGNLQVNYNGLMLMQRYEDERNLEAQHWQVFDGRRQTNAEIPRVDFDYPIGFRNEDEVLFLHQQKGASEVSVLSWHFREALVEKKLTIPARRNLLAKSAYRITSAISPDGAYGLVALPSRYGHEWINDIWLIDIAKKSRTLLMASTSSGGYLRVQWADDVAYVINDPSYSVDLAQGRMTPLRLPIPQEER